MIGLDTTGRKNAEQALRDARCQAEENRLILEIVIERLFTSPRFLSACIINQEVMRDERRKDDHPPYS